MNIELHSEAKAMFNYIISDIFSKTSDIILTFFD